VSFVPFVVNKNEPRLLNHHKVHQRHKEKPITSFSLLFVSFVAFIVNKNAPRLLTWIIRSAALAATKLNHKGHKGHKEKTQSLIAFLCVLCGLCGEKIFAAVIVFRE